MRLSFKNKATPDNIRVTIVAKSNSSIKLIGDVTAPGNNPTMVLNNGELVFCLAPVITQGVWVLNPEFNITNGIVTYSAYKNVRSTKYISHASLGLLDPVVRSFQSEGMQQWQAVKEAGNELTGVTNWTWDLVSKSIKYKEYPLNNSEYLYYIDGLGWNEPSVLLTCEHWWGEIEGGWGTKESVIVENNLCKGKFSNESNYQTRVVKSQLNPNYNPNNYVEKSIPFETLSQKIISNSLSSNQATSLLAEVYLEEVSKSIYETVQFVSKNELHPSFEENIIRVSYQGVDQEYVKINKYSTSALDFEKGLIDKIPGTVWNMEGSYLLQSKNVLFNDFSIETKALGENFYTTSKIITGGSTPFTIEIYVLIRNSNLKSDSNYLPVFTDNIADSGTGGQGLHIHKTTRQLMYQRESSIETNFSNYNFNNTKVNINELSKLTISYDSSALRFFINDKLDFVIGTLNGHYVKNKFNLLNNYNLYFQNTTAGLLDNINIFDGEARVVRDYDEHADKLVVDLAFDGENNSTKIVDNGTEKLTWTVSGGAKISTTQKFDGFSSLYLDGVPSSFIRSTNNVALPTDDFTINLDILPTALPSRVKPLLSTVGTPPINYPHSFTLAIEPNNTLQFYIYNKTYDGFSTVLNAPLTLQVGIQYNIKVVKYGNTVTMYVNDIFIISSTCEALIENTGSIMKIGRIDGGIDDRNFVGYIKNVKIYKGVAVIPENPTGKIQLDFDNNLTDKYNNSTWTNNGVTFDQVNSVKGYSSKYENGNFILSNNTDSLNFGANNFSLSFDSMKNTLNYTSYLFSNNIIHSDVSNKAIWLYKGSFANNFSYIDYKDKPINTTSHINTDYPNVWYSELVGRKESVLYQVKNDVIVLAHNLSNQTFDFRYGDAFILGKAQWANGADSSFNGYIDNFKSIKDYQEPIKIDKPAVHLPLETNAINTGFTPLTINSIGNPTYTTLDGKKCIKFESGKYLKINNNNIFNLGTSSDFYIELDFYKTSLSSGYILSDYTWSTGTTTLYAYTDGRIMSYVFDPNSDRQIFSENMFTVNSWNNLKFYRKGNVMTIELNGIKTIYNDYNRAYNFTRGGTTSLGTYATDSHNTFNGYMSNFKMFVGTSTIPETYHDKKALDLDFKPTRKSYLFKDNNNKCVIHPVNITQRDYQDSQYCCTFNGTNQYLQLGKNDLLNFGADDFIINLKFNKLNTITSAAEPLICAGENSPSNGRAGILLDSTNNTVYIHTQSNGVYYYISTTNSISDDVNNLIVVKKDGVISLILNNVTTSSNFNYDLNFNLNNDTYIGYYKILSKYFSGTIYSIKVLRNTSDITLLEDVWVDPFPPEPEVPPFEEGVMNFTELLEDIDPHNVVLDFKQLRYT